MAPTSPPYHPSYHGSCCRPLSLSSSSSLVVDDHSTHPPHTPLPSPSSPSSSSSSPSPMMQSPLLRALLVLCLLALLRGCVAAPAAAARHTRSIDSERLTHSERVRVYEQRQLAALGLSPALPSQPAPAQLFTQRLDHFDRSNDTVWQQRYYVNDSNWDGRGPVFFLFGHEEAMTPDLVAGTWVINALAEHFHALIVCLEHRFYGQSIPLHDASLHSLQRYLSTEQALQDAAVWSGHIRMQYNLSDAHRWVVMGRSYGGTLAALFRLKMPHLVTGALATSGPLQAKVDYSEYDETVGIALGSQCNSSLKAANEKVTALLSNASGQAQLAKDFGFCSPLTDPLQHAMLIERWADDVDGTVQYAVGNDTQDWCDRFLKAGGGDPYQALIELYFPKQSQCRQPYNYTQTVERAKLRPEAWEWQTCSAYGWYQTGSSPRQPISPLLSAELSIARCRDVYGVSEEQLYRNVAETNLRNGGFGIQASRVLYTNGEYDPWHRMAVYPPNTGGHDNVVYMIEKASHCTDFMPPSDRDSPSLKRLRTIQIDTIQRWLRD